MKQLIALNQFCTPVSINCSTLSETDGPVLLVHGGAWDIPDSEVDTYRQGMEEALACGIEMLSRGELTEEIVATVIAVMEDCGAFDAGRGSVLRSDRSAVLDAGIMRGSDLSFGSVGAVRTIKNPIRAAMSLMNEGRGLVRFAVGADGEDLARTLGCEMVTGDYQICQREIDRYELLRTDVQYHTSENFRSDSIPRGTVGCVVRGRDGDLVAGTSTGGTPLSPPGRVGDTPLPGSGFYANHIGGASATGWGEAISTVNLCSRLVDGLETPATLERLLTDHLANMFDVVKNPQGRGATGGVIVVASDGRFGWCYTTPRMARAFWSPSNGTRVYV